MTDALCLDTATRLAYELHDFIKEIDAVRWRREMEAALLRRLESLKLSLNLLLEEASTASVDLSPHLARLAELASVLREHTPDTSLQRSAARRQWRRLRVRLLPAYEALASGLRAEAVVIPPIRPTNLHRIALHLTGMAIALTLQLTLPAVALIIAAGLSAGTCWTLELLRRRDAGINRALMAFFRRVAHPLEAQRVNSATWFVTALFALSWLDSPLIGGAAVVVLGVGDPIAGLIGRRWGRRPLLNNRTLEGSLAFVVSSFLAVSLFLLCRGVAPLAASSLAMAGGAALAGALAELMSRRLDDNLLIPLCAASSAWLSLWLAGGSLS